MRLTLLQQENSSTPPPLVPRDAVLKLRVACWKLSTPLLRPLHKSGETKLRDMKGHVSHGYLQRSSCSRLAPFMHAKINPTQVSSREGARHRALRLLCLASLPAFRNRSANKHRSDLDGKVSSRLPPSFLTSLHGKLILDHTYRGTHLCDPFFPKFPL